MATIREMDVSRPRQRLDHGCPRCARQTEGAGAGACPLARLSARSQRPVLWVGIIGLLLVLATLLGPHPAPALAYIDPGVGAMLMQLAVGAFFGLLFYLRSVRQYVARLFGRAKDRSE